MNLYRKILARESCAKFNKMVLHLSLRSLGILNYENDEVSGEKYLINTVLRKIISSNEPILFDIGANMGDYTRLLLSSFPTATIYDFEPHPVTFMALKGRTLSKKIKLYNLALGDKCGMMTLYDRSDWDGSPLATLHRAVISDIHKKKTLKYRVNVDTLSNFVQRAGVRYIDFVKIDTEGNELAVLQGALPLLENESIGCLQFEFNEMNTVSRVFFRDIRKVLSNYKLFRLLPSGLLPLDDSIVETELFAYQNIFAISERFAKESKN